VIEPEPLQQIDRTYVLWRGHKLSYFSGCDYFRLSSHPKVLRALVEGLERFGLTVAASRLTTGNHVLYRQLEQRLASFCGVESALLAPTGYVANLAIAQALCGQYSHVLIDEAAHVSLRDASQAMQCPVLKFKHRSVSDVASCVGRCGPGSRLILFTDGLFSRDGSVAPLNEYLRILPRDASILVDDAHGIGVLGKNGRGAAERTGAKGRIIQTITLSKAIGVYGGAIVGSKTLRRKILRRSRLVIGSTPLPLPLVHASLRALSILKSGKALRSRLAHNAHHVRSALEKAGVSIASMPGPIICLVPNNKVAMAQMKRALYNAGIYPPFIHYPGGPQSGYFRFVISSEHSVEQLENLAKTLAGVSTLFFPFRS
jgi:7-keto-8-aminopelargonate synthetase-like enzyme